MMHSSYTKRYKKFAKKSDKIKWKISLQKKEQAKSHKTYICFLKVKYYLKTPTKISQVHMLSDFF